MGLPLMVIMMRILIMTVEMKESFVEIIHSLKNERKLQGFRFAVLILSL